MELVYGVCLKYLKNTDDSKDAVVDIFEELIEKLKKHEVDNFKGWLYQVAKNHCLMKLRKQKLKPVNIDISIVQSEENIHLDGEMVKADYLEREENFKKMKFCLDRLSAEQRTAVEMFYLQEKCYKEISDKTGIEWNKVRSFIQNGRRNLKICMESQKAIEK